MYQCTICQKEFSTERAMAGHKSSHNRSSVSYRQNRSKKVITPIEDILEKILPTPKECEYCSKEFKNGWQLGGHKSKCSLNPRNIKNDENLIQRITKDLFRLPEIRHVM